MFQIFFNVGGKIAAPPFQFIVVSGILLTVNGSKESYTTGTIEENNL